jgi:hypothetical protein
MVPFKSLYPLLNILFLYSISDTTQNENNRPVPSVNPNAENPWFREMKPLESKPVTLLAQTVEVQT